MYSKDTKKKAREQRLSGKTFSEISKDLNVERTTVGRWCKDIILPNEILNQIYPPGRSKEEEKAARRKWYDKNAEKERKRLKVSNSKRYRKIRNDIRNYKVQKCCAKCGENHPACLDLHHLDRATKILAVAALLQKMHNHEKIWQEVMKCQVLCANCHRKEHYVP